MNTSENITNTPDQTAALHAKLDLILVMLSEAQNGQIGDWLSQDRTLKLTGLSLRTLLNLRNAGLVRSTTLAKKGIWYSKNSLIKLMNKNEENI